VEEVRKLLKPGSRRRVEARARIRPVAIMEGSVRVVMCNREKGISAGVLRRIELGRSSRLCSLGSLRCDLRARGPDSL